MKKLVIFLFFLNLYSQLNAQNDLDSAILEIKKQQKELNLLLSEVQSCGCYKKRIIDSIEKYANVIKKFYPVAIKFYRMSDTIRMHGAELFQIVRDVDSIKKSSVDLDSIQKVFYQKRLGEWKKENKAFSVRYDLLKTKMELLIISSRESSYQLEKYGKKKKFKCRKRRHLFAFSYA